MLKTVKTRADLDLMASRLGASVKAGGRPKEEAQPAPEKPDPMEAYVAESRKLLQEMRQQRAQLIESVGPENLRFIEKAIDRLQATIVEAFALRTSAPVVVPAPQARNLKVVITSRDQNRDVKTFNIQTTSLP